MMYILRKFKPKPPPAPVLSPSPSDIFAGLVAAKMIASPQSVVFSQRKGNTSDQYGSGQWDDLERGIQVIAFRLNSVWSYNTKDGCLRTFTFKGEKLAPSNSGKTELLKAFEFCAQFQIRAAEADRQYKGDMAACEGIESLMTS